MSIEHFDDEKNTETKGKMIQYENHYDIGDHVLLSKDREGVVKYIGIVPSISEETLQYGIELMAGNIGEHNGTYEGKYYFLGNEQRCVFVDSEQLRRKLTAKDESSNNRQRRQDALQTKFDVNTLFVVKHDPLHTYTHILLSSIVWICLKKRGKGNFEVSFKKLPFSLPFFFLSNIKCKILKEEGQELGIVSPRQQNASIDMIAGVWDITYNDGIRNQYDIFTNGRVDYDPDGTSHWEGEITIKYDTNTNQYIVESENNPSVYEVIKFKDPTKQDLNHIEVEYFDDEKAISKVGVGIRKGSEDNQQSASLTEEDAKKNDYQVGDLVVLTQDREGYIRYIGEVHYAEGIFYGIELIGGTTGTHKGTIRGKEYFR
ncbi:hypothetical protein RFI_17467, partial [Reticulomyxa filosa]